MTRLCSQHATRIGFSAIPAFVCTASAAAPYAEGIEAGFGLLHIDQRVACDKDLLQVALSASHRGGVQLSVQTLFNRSQRT